MARALKAKKLASITAARDGSTYRLQIEDETGKKVLFELTSDQTVRLADVLDSLLADEEEQRPRPIASAPALSGAQEGLGTVKWYNVVKGFGFVMPDAGSEELFLHRSVVEQAGLSQLEDGTRVRIQITQGKKGP